jgi:hypothetical protein
MHCARKGTPWLTEKQKVQLQESPDDEKKTKMIEHNLKSSIAGVSCSKQCDAVLVNAASRGHHQHTLILSTGLNPC